LQFASLLVLFQFSHIAVGSSYIPKSCHVVAKVRNLPLHKPAKAGIISVFPL
jgi:hypothetical protein